MDPEPHNVSDSQSSQAAKWRRLLADVPPAVVRKLRNHLDLENPPDLVNILIEGLASPKSGSNPLVSLLLSEGLVERALGDPLAMNIDQAVEVARGALARDSHFDSKLLEWIAEPNARPHQIHRGLLVLMRLRSSRPYLVTPILRLMGNADSTIRSYAARVLGRASANVGLLESMLGDEDPRVISSLIQSIAERSDIAPTHMFHLLRMATQHHHPGVSAIANALLSRFGDSAAAARLEAMLNSGDGLQRTSARWAMETAGA